jgi:hypothetical protein
MSASHILNPSFRDNPCRAPHWKWLRVQEIDAGGQRATRAIDGPDGFTWIRRAVRMKRRYERAGNRRDAMHALILRDKELFWAHSIWLAEKNPVRWGIEARVLAGETNEEIAKKVGTDPGVIDAYISVFFDVRDRLQNLDYVQNVIMADAVTRGLQERHYDLLWKLLGFKGGQHVLDAVINRGTDVAKPTSSDGVGTFFQDFAISSMKYKAALASLTVQVNTHTQLPLIESFVKYVEIEKNSDNAMKAQSSIVDNIGVMLTSLPFKIGTKLDSEGAKMLPFDNGAAELRGDEMLVISAGGQLENTADIQKLSFPGD